MQIEIKQLQTLRITNVEGLDPLTVTLENFEPGKGKITLECWGEAWSASWNAMSGDTVEAFFCRADDDYLAKNLHRGIDRTLDDLEGLQDWVKADIIDRRKSGDLGKVNARELFDIAEDKLSCVDSLESVADYMHPLLGDEWWYGLPSKPNPQYEYLCLIIQTARNALQQLKANKQLATA